MKVTAGLVEQHIHGAFGCDFMHCSVEELLECAKSLRRNGVCAFFPTIMTDSIDKIKERISVVKKAKEIDSSIIGVHLEGPFINPEKSGIHDKKYILPLDIQIYREIEDDVIKIVTLAPEFDLNNEFINYLKSKNVKVSLGHSISNDVHNVNQVTHLYNAMAGFVHRGKSTVVNALISDVYVELIADSVHVSDEVLKLTFKQKNLNKIILISDALPLAHSEIKQQMFAGQMIYNRNSQLVNEIGVLAGSSMLLCDVVKNLVDRKIINFEDAIQCASSNQLKYHNIQNNLKVYWNDNNLIEKVELE